MKPRFNLKRAAGLLLLSLLAIVIFRTVKEISLTAYVVIIAVYSLITLVAALWYISCNKGLVGTKVTPDLLPESWSEEEKEAFMAEYRERREKSKKLLVILLPMIATFFFEAIDIYFLQGFIAKFMTK